MKILIIGGTRFVGRHLVQSAIALGHHLTLFNRGKSYSEFLPQVETIVGDREYDLNRLSDRHWDAVIDTCGYVPRIVKMSAQALKSAVDMYVFISTLSAYADFNQPGLEESYPLGRVDDESVEEITDESYGPLKALCEKTVEEIFPGQTLIIRPGLIVGPYDPTDRFTYWPVRVARGGKVVAPSHPNQPTQFIHARDLADFIIKLIVRKTPGVYNAIGPEKPYPLGELLAVCKQVSGSDARFIWVPENTLAKYEINPWIELPLWIPQAEAAGAFQVSNTKACTSGLTFKPVDTIVRETLGWAQSRSPDHRWCAGLSAEKESWILTELNE